MLHTIEKNGFKEQDPEEWYSAFCTLSHALTGKIPAQTFRLIFSGQMQDVIQLEVRPESVWEMSTSLSDRTGWRDS